MKAGNAMIRGVKREQILDPTDYRGAGANPVHYRK